MRVFANSVGEYFAGGSEEQVIAYLLKHRGADDVRGLYEVHPEMVKLLEVPIASGVSRSFPDQIAAITAQGGRFPCCIASERC
jgi:hypothetical protein